MAREPRTPRRAAAALAVGGLLLTAVVVLLALSLRELTDSRRHIEAQDAKVSRLLKATRPALDAAVPLARRTLPVIESARPVVRGLAGALPMLRSSGAALDATLDRLPALAVAGQRFLGDALPTVQELGDASLAPALDELTALVAPLNDGQRLVATLDSVRELIDETENLRLPRRAARTSHRIGRLLEVQRHSLRLQRRTLRVQTHALDTLLRSLKHIRSLDAKTGGTFPPE